MKIKNNTRKPLRFNQSRKRNNIVILTGEKDYPVSLNDKEQSFRLRALKDAGLISFSEGEKKDVRNTEETIERVEQVGDADSSKRELSKQKQNKSK